MALEFKLSFTESSDYHSAVSLVSSKYDCSRTTVTNADTKFRWLVDYLQRIVKISPENLERVLDDLIAKPDHS